MPGLGPWMCRTCQRTWNSGFKEYCAVCGAPRHPHSVSVRTTFTSGQGMLATLWQVVKLLVTLALLVAILYFGLRKWHA